MENETLKPINEGTNEPKSASPKKPNKFLALLSNNKLAVFLFIVLVIVFLWSIIRVNVLERNFEKEKSSIQTIYDTKIDSLTFSHLSITSEVFAWAIRSELIRQNIDQVNQFFLTYIQQDNVQKIRLVDIKNSKIILSTDKKEEGTVYGGSDLSKDDTIINTRDSLVSVITPVMGLNSKLGMLVIDYVK